MIPEDTPALPEPHGDQPRPRPRIDSAALLPPQSRSRRRDVIDALARPGHPQDDYC